MAISSVLTTLSLGVSTGIGISFGETISKKNWKQIKTDFQSLTIIKKILLSILALGLMFGLYLNFGQPITNDPTALFITNLVKQVSTGFLIGIITKIFLIKFYECLNPPQTIRVA